MGVWGLHAKLVGGVWVWVVSVGPVGSLGFACQLKLVGGVWVWVADLGVDVVDWM